jgi:hypothetical protein
VIVGALRDVGGRVLDVPRSALLTAVPVTYAEIRQDIDCALLLHADGNVLKPDAREAVTPQRGVVTAR